MSLRPRRFALLFLVVVSVFVISSSASVADPASKVRQRGWHPVAAKFDSVTATDARKPAVSRTSRRAGAPVPGSGLQIGLVANSQGMGTLEGIGDEQDRVVQTGARWIREELLWSQVEPQPGVYDFAHYDDLMSAAAARGLRVLPVLDDAPAWAEANWNTIPRNPAQFADYVAAVVNRYGPDGSFWTANPQWASLAPQWFELWNEPYYAPGGADEYDPGRYARLVRAAVRAGRAASPSAKFLLAADTTGRQLRAGWTSWVDALYDAMPDLNAWFDGVAIHPYGSDLTGLTGAGYAQFRRIELLRRAFMEHGAGDKPFWATELGWPTCTDDNGCVSEERQAVLTRAAITALRTTYSSFMRAVFLYHLNDWGPRDEGNREYWFGLDRHDGSHKPAWYALRAITGVDA